MPLLDGGDRLLKTPFYILPDEFLLYALENARIPSSYIQGLATHPEKPLFGGMMTQFILTLLTLGLLCGLPGRRPTDPQAKPEDLTVDLTQCKPETRSFSWGLGSESFVIKGRRGKKCIIQHTSEIEGGYTRSECRLPTSLGRLIISENCRSDAGDYGRRCGTHYSADISKYCKVVKRGNFFYVLKPN
jgi:hypothetical protein